MSTLLHETVEKVTLWCLKVFFQLYVSLAGILRSLHFNTELHG